MKVIKPKLTHNAMCIYKFTLSNGFYYLGATTNLGERILTHLKKYRDKKLPKALMYALETATSIKFEFVRFVNDRKYLKKEEEKYLCKHVGLPMCLNTEIYCTSAFKRGEAIFKIALLDPSGMILKIFNTPSLAAKYLGITRFKVEQSTLIKYPRTKYVLRRLDKNGGIILLAKPFKEYPSLRKPVNQYDKKMNFIATFESITDASRKLNLDRKGISEVVKGRQQTSKGFIFSLATISDARIQTAP